MDKDHVHRGMRSIRSFIHSLTDQPTENKFFPEVIECATDKSGKDRARTKILATSKTIQQA